MTFGHMLYQLLIGPIELLFETIFSIADNLTGNSGLAIIGLSLAMNLLLLPLYRRADMIQAEERAAEQKLSYWTAHIKKTFTGDERFMMLQTYNRQNNYRPFYALKGSLPLVLEIPFFIAAYHFLSNLAKLKGTPFGPVADLGAPDGLLSAAGLTIHALPILMTLINCVSSAVYTKGLPAKDKIQLYAMALIFLVLLYRSPSGLVIYWTMNNLFSLVKNLVVKIIGEKKAAERTAAVKKENQNTNRLFLSGAVFLALLTGVLIPSAVILASPAEFVQVADFYSPLRHVLNAALLSFGTFVIWLGVFYFMAGDKVKPWFAAAVWIASAAGTVDYMFFGTKLGTMSAQLKFDTPPYFFTREKLINLAVLAVLFIAVLFIWFKKRQIVQISLVALIAAVTVLSAVNMTKIQSSLPQIRQAAENDPSEEAHFSLSKDGKNVIVLMLDRAIGSYLPYLFQEAPELEKQFAGFTYYPRTLSFGGFTNTGAPALFGGYEYTPEAMNARADEALSDKHDEALKLMPVLFDEAGYEVTVCEPSYAGYDWIPDLSIYDDYPGITAYLTEQGQFTLTSKEEQAAQLNRVWERNFFCYGLMKCVPVAIQRYLYHAGTYYIPDSTKQMGTQTEKGISAAEGMERYFVNCYAFLKALPEITTVSEEGNTFLLMTNSTTHELMLLQEPEYEPKESVDNTEYDRTHQDRFVVDGREMKVETVVQMKHYQDNMAALIQLGNWFDWLRENGVYDNTRIIIAADHGRNLQQFEDWVFGSDPSEDIMLYNPLMLVKDFGAQEFTTDYTFMTNADVPTIALGGLIEDPVNPFTGNKITGEEKNAGPLHVFGTRIWDAQENHGNTFLPGPWYELSGDMFDITSWKKLGEY